MSHSCIFLWASVRVSGEWCNVFEPGSFLPPFGFSFLRFLTSPPPYFSFLSCSDRWTESVGVSPEKKKTTITPTPALWLNTISRTCYWRLFPSTTTSHWLASLLAGLYGCSLVSIREWLTLSPKWVDSIRLIMPTIFKGGSDPREGGVTSIFVWLSCSPMRKLTSLHWSPSSSHFVGSCSEHTKRVCQHGNINLEIKKRGTLRHFLALCLCPKWLVYQKGPWANWHETHITIIIIERVRLFVLPWLKTRPLPDNTTPPKTRSHSPGNASMGPFWVTPMKKAAHFRPL